MFEDISEAFIALREHNNPFGCWTLEWIFSEKPKIDDLNKRLAHGLSLFTEANKTEWTILKIKDKNWLEESYKQFQPFEIGPFFIHGSHYDGTPPSDRLWLQIDAATAFGTGEHGTTKGCLQAMIALKDEGVCPWNVLDMGTGSGILAIAAWKLWQTPILAVDNETEAVRVAEKHQKENNVSNAKTAMTCVHGDGYNTPDVLERSPFDLIIANILAAPLIDMAPQCAEVSDENGHLILSGMLIDQVPKVQSAYETEGYKIINQINIDPWSTLVLQLS